MSRVIIMRCENIFCVYQKNDECILKEIELDVLGQCRQCIYINLPQTILEEQKNKTLFSFNSQT